MSESNPAPRPPDASGSRNDFGRIGRAWVLIAPILILAQPVFASAPVSHEPIEPGGMSNTVQHYLNQLKDPWTWFGLSANGLFFLRFFWQWVVSERHKRSIVPVAFWYFSLAGATAMFLYGIHLGNLVVTLSGLLPTVIYVRNLMLIYSRAERLRRAGLPVGPIGSTVTDRDLPG